MEEWIETNNKANSGKTIIKVSNKGRIKRKNGNPPEESLLRQYVSINGKRTFIHRFIAEHFIPKTQEDIKLNRDCIDHITHNPVGMNVNDIRNLRWCTNKENSNFEEAKKNQSKANKGNKNRLGIVTSEFGRKYKDYYGYSKKENPDQYNSEYRYYHSHNHRCSWE